MKQYKKILVPVDGSEQSYHALSQAVEMIKDTNSELVVMTVKDTLRFYGLAGASVGIVETPELDRIAKQIFLKSSALTKTLDHVTTKEVAGSPKKEIIKYAKDNDIDVIVMGSTGAGMIDKIMAGSTTNYVVNHAPCNVIVVQ